MKKVISLLSLIIFITLTVGIILCKEKAVNSKTIVITVTNSNIAEIVSSIGGNDIEVNTLLSPLMCPSNNDITPKMIEAVSKSKAVIANNWEKWINKISDSAIFIETSGNLMIPDNRKKAAREIFNILAACDTEKINKYKDAESKYIKELEEIKKIETNMAKQVAGVKVICNDKIGDLLTSLGFNVVAIYGKKEDLSVKQLAELIKIGKKEKVSFIIDNMQAGSDTGEELANNLNVKRIVLSNFVLKNSYIKTYIDNISEIEKALK